MTEELEQALYEDFPLTFREELEWGIECDDGWEWLIRLACSYMEAKIEQWKSTHKRIQGIPQAMQIKQKCGQLRFYVNDNDADTMHFLDAVARFSEHVCEQCGKYGKLRRRQGTAKTLCDIHYSGWKR